MGSSFLDWLTGRLMEVSTYVGGAIIVFCNLGLTSSNSTAAQVLQFVNQYGPTVGAFLVGMSERRHRDTPGFKNIKEATVG